MQTEMNKKANECGWMNKNSFVRFKKKLSVG